MADEAAEQRIAIGLAGPDPLALARELLARDLWPGGPGAVPAKLRVDQEKKPATGDWLTTWAPRAERALSAYFRESPDEYLLVRPGLATLARFRFPADPERVLDLLAGLPFT